MRINCYYPSYNEEHVEVVKSYCRGLRKVGFDAWLLPALQYCHHSDGNRPPLAVLFGVGKKAVPASVDRKLIIDGQMEAGKGYIVLETGFVKRNKYYMAGFGGLNGRAEFHNADSPSDRWDKLDVELKPWRTTNDKAHILLCGQVPWDASVQDTDHIKWLQTTAAAIQERTSRPLHFSPHPLGPKLKLPDVRSAAPGPLAKKAAGAHAVVTFSSNSAVESVIQGIPSFSFDMGSMARDVTSQDLQDLDDPPTPDRTQWAHNLAYTQWTLDEFASGEAARHLLRNL